MKELLLQFAHKELHIDELLAFQYLVDYNSRYEIFREERNTNVFRDLKSASEKITIHCGNGEQVISDFSKLNHDLPSNSIITLDVNGFMASEDTLCSYGIKSLSNALLAYKNNSNVIGAKLNFDSGGGEAMSGYILHDAIAEFKKPVIAYVYNAGSAAYLAASRAKEIVAANENSKVGSIGAYISLVKSFIEKYGNDIIDIYSDYSPDKNKEFNSLLKNDHGPLKEMLNKSVEIFHSKVKNNRALGKDPEGTLKGGMFFAAEGKKRGLVDFIGDNEFALSRVRQYSKTK